MVVAQETGDRRSAWEEFKTCLGGATLRDHDEGLKDTFPGAGCLDWGRFREILQTSPFWMLDPLDEIPLDDVCVGMEFLRGLERGPEPSLEFPAR
jgi:hypothetical protein